MAPRCICLYKMSQFQDLLPSNYFFLPLLPFNYQGNYLHWFSYPVQLVRQ